MVKLQCINKDIVSGVVTVMDYCNELKKRGKTLIVIQSVYINTVPDLLKSQV